MKDGELRYNLPEIDEIQEFYLHYIQKLPKMYKKLDKIHNSPLIISEKLKRLTTRLIQKYN